MYVGVVETPTLIRERHRWMRHTSSKLPLTTPWIGHDHTADWAAMSPLPATQLALSDRIQHDLEVRCARNAQTGRPGLTGEQTLCILLRQLTGWTYPDLAFHLPDWATYRACCPLGICRAAPSKSALTATLRRVRPATLAAMNDAFVTSDALQYGACAHGAWMRVSRW